jgi:hypothetical protein
VARRIVERRIHQDVIGAALVQAGSRERLLRRCDVERKSVCAISETVASDILLGERREVAIPFNKGYPHPRNPSREREPRRSHTGSKIDRQVAGSGGNGRGEQDGVVPDTMSAGWLFQL